MSTRFWPSTSGCRIASPPASTSCGSVVLARKATSDDVPVASAVAERTTGISARSAGIGNVSASTPGGRSGISSTSSPPKFWRFAVIIIAIDPPRGTTKL